MLWPASWKCEIFIPGVPRRPSISEDEPDSSEARILKIAEDVSECIFYILGLDQTDSTSLNVEYYLVIPSWGRWPTDLPSSVCVVGCAFTMAVLFYQTGKTKAEIEAF